MSSRYERSLEPVKLTEEDIAAALARMTPEEREFCRRLPLDEASVLVALHAYFPEVKDVTDD